MNPIPPAADLSKLKGILGNAKKLMTTVNEGNYEKGNVNSESLSQSTEGYLESGQVPQQHQQQGMGLDPTRKPKPITESSIANSRMPDAIKKAMIENPIAQPTMNHTFNLDDVADLLDEAPIPNQPRQAAKAPATRTQMNESVIQSNDKFTVSEVALRGIIKDVLIEYLSVDYSKNLTEGVIKKTINTLIKEGKIKSKS